MTRSAVAAAGPDVTVAELRAWLLAAHGVSASLGGMWNARSTGSA